MAWSRAFESQHCILDGHFLNWFVVKVVLFVWKDENEQKEAREGPFKKQTIPSLLNKQWFSCKSTISWNFKHWGNVLIKEGDFNIMTQEVLQ